MQIHGKGNLIQERFKKSPDGVKEDLRMRAGQKTTEGPASQGEAGRGGTCPRTINKYISTRKH